MKLRGYRQHRGTGEVWAVESEDSVDVGCVGPISERDADARLLAFFAYQSMGLFPYRVQDFVRLDLCPICSLAILGTAPAERLNGNMAHASCMAERPTFEDEVGRRGRDDDRARVASLLEADSRVTETAGGI